MSAISGVGGAPPAPPKAETVGEQFEQQFVGLMLKEMKKSTPNLFGEGQVADTFGDQMMQGLAQQMTGAGGFGLAERIDAQLSKLPMQAPLEDMHVSSAFGERISPISGEHVHHDGLDLAAPEGTPIRPVRPGIVRFAGEIDGYGLSVIVDHGNGIESLYAHCSELAVEKGEAVGYADAIGRVGSTGRSTGPHLHLEIRDNDEPIDPATFF
mgnify:CR=1 FL=1